MNSGPDATIGESTSGGRSNDLLWESLPLALGLLAFALTANSILGIAVACLKFGWKEFLTVAWLLWTDPDHSRGLACAGFHAALGFVKTCVAGLVAVIAVLGLEA